MGVNQEYYKLSKYPSLQIPRIGSSRRSPIIRGAGVAPEGAIWYFQFAAPVPANPMMADFFNNTYPVVSRRVADVIIQLVPEKVQYIPGQIDDRKGNVYGDYCVINSRNYIQDAIDLRRSDVDYNERRGVVFNARTLVLCEDLADRVPLDERLLFCPRQCSFHALFHQTVVDAVMALDPEPILRFVPLSKWGDDMAFRK